MLLGIVTKIGDVGIGEASTTFEKPDIAGVPAKIEYDIGVPLIIVYGILKLVAVEATSTIDPIFTDGNALTVTVVAVDVALQPLAFVTVTLYDPLELAVIL